MISRAFVWSLSVLVAYVPLWSSPRPAQASPGSEAKAYYQKAMKAYNLSEFSEALTAFKEAYRVKPDPAFLFNIAQCYRRMNDPEQASAFYHSYLREAPSAPNRPEVERIITEMDATTAAKKAEDDKQRAEAERQRLEAEHARTTAVVTTDNAVTARPIEKKKPLVKRGWFWGAVVGGVVVVGGAVALGVVLSRPGNPSPTLGTTGVQ